MNKDWSPMRDSRAGAPRHGVGSRPLSTRRARGWPVASAILLAALVGGYLIFGGKTARKPPAVEVVPALTVTVATPRRVVWPDKVSASGVVAAWQEASIGTQIGGYQLVEVKVNVGDQVRRGQVLARLDPALLRAEETQLLARYEQAKANSQRALALRNSGGISDQEVLAAETDAKAATAVLAAKRLELGYTAVVAPDDGVITARAATLGAVASPGQELFRMIRQNRLEWRGELTAPQLKAVAAGQKIDLKLPDGSPASAAVRQIAPAMDAQSRLALAYADIAPGSRARAGMYVSGDIAVGASPGLAVPAESVVIRDGRSYVMVLKAGERTPTVSVRPVRPGRRDGGLIEILDGLAGGERLVASGAGFLNEGDVVRVARRQEAGQ